MQISTTVYSQVLIRTPEINGVMYSRKRYLSFHTAAQDSNADSLSRVRSSSHEPLYKCVCVHTFTNIYMDMNICIHGVSKGDTK